MSPRPQYGAEQDGQVNSKQFKYQQIYGQSLQGANHSYTSLNKNGS